MIIIHVKIWTTLSTNSESYPSQILPQFDNSMNSALADRDKQQGSLSSTRHLSYVMLDRSTSHASITSPEALSAFQIFTRQTPPFSKSSRVIRPPPMMLKGR
ncbi:hypothetical protein BYT27DRAFT_6508161 [Phlegmacium glaucopus]|nr:hypothetical protein BYT27DRAFT_6508161 [Phlegmacium glaucopus]